MSKNILWIAKTSTGKYDLSAYGRTEQEARENLVKLYQAATPAYGWYSVEDMAYDETTLEDFWGMWSYKIDLNFLEKPFLAFIDGEQFLPTLDQDTFAKVKKYLQKEYGEIRQYSDKDITDTVAYLFERGHVVYHLKAKEIGEWIVQVINEED